MGIRAGGGGGSRFKVFQSKSKKERILFDTKIKWTTTHHHHPSNIIELVSVPLLPCLSHMFVTHVRHIHSSHIVVKPPKPNLFKSCDEHTHESQTLNQLSYCGGVIK